MADSVISATVEEGKRHIWWIVGGLVALVLLIWYMRSANSSTAAPAQQFTFSYGPSDAQVVAGTQLAIAQAADQTAVSMQTAQLASTGTIASDYYGALTQNSANQAAVLNNATAANLSLGLAQTTAGVTIAQGAQSTTQQQTTAAQTVDLAAITAQQDITNNQTSAGLQLGLGSQAVTNNQTSAGLQIANLGDQASETINQQNINGNLSLANINSSTAASNAALAAANASTAATALQSSGYASTISNLQSIISAALSALSVPGYTAASRVGTVSGILSGA